MRHLTVLAKDEATDTSEAGEAPLNRPMPWRRRHPLGIAMQLGVKPLGMAHVGLMHSEGSLLNCSPLIVTGPPRAVPCPATMDRLHIEEKTAGGDGIALPVGVSGRAARGWASG